MSYTEQQLNSAIDGLQAFENLEGKVLRDKLTEYVNSLSVNAEGSTTVLYANNADGTGTNFGGIAKDMAKDPNTRVIDKTLAANVINSDEFTRLSAKSIGMDINGKSLDEIVDEYWAIPRDSEAGKIRTEHLFDGKDGLWAQTSKRFAAETEGAVKIMTELPRADSVLLQTELPELLKNNRTLTSAF